MFQIAFCDDELATLNTLRVLLDQYRVERNQEIAASYLFADAAVLRAVVLSALVLSRFGAAGVDGVLGVYG